MANFITNVAVSISTRDEGNLQARRFLQINENLNKGTGGARIYLWYKQGSSAAPITRLQVSFNKEMAEGLFDAGYEKIDKNLNAGTGGKEIYLWYFRGSGEFHTPIKELAVTTQAKKEARMFTRGWERLACDLNRDVGVDWTHIWVKRTEQTYISHVIASDDYAYDAFYFEDGYIRIDEDTNKSTGGSNVFIWYRQTTNPDRAITELAVAHDGDRANLQKKRYTPVDVNLNSQNQGGAVYLWYKKTKAEEPIVGMTLLVNPAARPAYERNVVIVLEKDLNDGLGQPIYLCYKN